MNCELCEVETDNFKIYPKSVGIITSVDSFLALCDYCYSGFVHKLYHEFKNLGIKVINYINDEEFEHLIFRDEGITCAVTLDKLKLRFPYFNLNNKELTGNPYNKEEFENLKKVIVDKLKYK